MKTKNKSQPTLSDHGLETDAYAQLSPANGIGYRFSCPIDHFGNFVHLRGWTAAETNEHPFILIHDVGENIKMYKPAAKYLCEQGYSCYSYDQRGHRGSLDKTKRVFSFDELAKDLLQVVNWVKKLHNGKPPVLVGQGYGCLVACEMVARHPNLLYGLILFAPTIELARAPSPLIRFLIRVLADAAPNLRLPKVLRPRFSNPLHRPLENSITTRLVDNLIKQDDLRITANFANELISGMERTPTNLINLKVRTLVLRPEADEIAKFDLIGHILSENFAQNDFIESQSIPGLHHNALTESPKNLKIVADLMIRWVKGISRGPQDLEKMVEDKR